MTVVRKYAGAVHSNPGSWATPNNMLGEPEATPLCGVKFTSVHGYYIAYLDGYGFDIPLDATINKVTINIKSIKSYGGDNCVFRFRCGSADMQALGTKTDASCACVDSTWGAPDVWLGNSFFTPARLNAIEGDSGEAYTWVEFDQTAPAISGARIDSVFIEVDYTEASVGQPYILRVQNVPGMKTFILTLQKLFGGFLKWLPLFR
jgi:hypothetical protein